MGEEREGIAREGDTRERDRDGVFGMRAETEEGSLRRDNRGEAEAGGLEERR